MLALVNFSKVSRAISSIMIANSTHIAVFVMRKTMMRTTYQRSLSWLHLKPTGSSFSSKDSWKCFANFEEELYDIQFARVLNNGRTKSQRYILEAETGLGSVDKLYRATI